MDWTKLALMAAFKGSMKQQWGEFTDDDLITLREHVTD
jgi:uncharacterized protein YjbJ (UPF0337 family)